MTIRLVKTKSRKQQIIPLSACAETNIARLSENMGLDYGRLSISIERGGTA